ncbi:MAG: TraB/GumN family protein [Candidatus Altiarchaeota archaeon]|nr:TraB/GumN family protein [Candidatus Altiarchaeota archaeon]
MSIKIIGTGHILRKSVEDVERGVSGEVPDFIAVELDVRRFAALAGVGFRPEEYRRSVSFRELVSYLAGGGSFPVFMQGVLGLIQREFGERYGISPGSDMCAAIRSGQALGSRIALIDRDIEITLNRLLNVPLKEFWGLLFAKGDDMELVSRLFEGNIEDILEKENIHLILDAFRKRLPKTYKALIDERDRYMAYKLWVLQRHHPEARILAVVGAGHAEGINRHLEGMDGGCGIDLGGLVAVKKPGLFKMLFLAVLIMASFILIRVWGFLGRK